MNKIRVRFDQLFVPSRKIGKISVNNPKLSRLRQSRSGKTDLDTSPRVVRLIPRRARSISSRYGANTNLKAKNTLFATSKPKVLHKKRPNIHIIIIKLEPIMVWKQRGTPGFWVYCGFWSLFCGLWLYPPEIEGARRQGWVPLRLVASRTRVENLCRSL